MKHFLRTILRFFGIITAVIVLVFIFRFSWTKAIDWRFADNQHIVFMGASHIAMGVNDTLYEGSVNMGQASERYLFTYLKLQNILAVNPQIDTVFLEFAPTDMHRNTDSKYYSVNEMGLFLPLYFPYFTVAEWKLYAGIDASRAGALLLQKVVKDLPENYQSYGRFRPSEVQFDRRRNKHEVAEWLEKGAEINYRYLNKIISLCRDRDIQLYFLYMPMFQPESFYDQDYFYAIFERNFSAIELLDYSNLKMPDHYRSDENHLNNSGARFFTKQLLSDMRNRGE